MKEKTCIFKYSDNTFDYETFPKGTTAFPSCEYILKPKIYISV